MTWLHTKGTGIEAQANFDFDHGKAVLCSNIHHQKNLIQGDMYMKYLINIDKESGKAHLWDDGDSYCKMYSTGGMRKKKYKIYDNAQDREICLMCQNVWAEIHEFTGKQHDKL